jgi:quercetin dioxygenase-like cupin family protein
MASVSLTALAILLVVGSSIVVTAHAQAPAGKAPPMVVQRNGTVPSAKGPEQFFSGPVRVDMLYQPQGPTRASVGAVTFEPGSRSAWHTHPLGQALIVTAGTGWVQEEGGTKIEMGPGDVIWCPPGVKHWHGATATTGVTHLAVTEALLVELVDRMEAMLEGTLWLVGGAYSLADIAAVPFIARIDEIAPEALAPATHPRTSDWWARIRQRPAFAQARVDRFDDALRARAAQPA